MLSLERTISLIGLMGAGKSAIGVRLAKRLEVPFVDSDAEIEARAGKSIAEIFSQDGEVAFRELEREVIQGIVQQGPHVLATGGGAFINDQTRELLTHETIVIWLRASVDVLYERVKHKHHRPLLEQGDKREILMQLAEARYPLYDQANITVDTDNKPHKMVVNKIVTQLWNQGTS